MSYFRIANALRLAATVLAATATACALPPLPAGQSPGKASTDSTQPMADTTEVAANLVDGAGFIAGPGDDLSWLPGGDAQQEGVFEDSGYEALMEQSVAHVNNAARLYRILTQQLGIAPKQIVLVLNRYDKHAAVQTDMVIKAVGCDEPFKLPNMYELALDSMNTAIPLFELDKDSQVTRALIALGTHISGNEPPEVPGLFKRTLAAITARAHA